MNFTRTDEVLLQITKLDLSFGVTQVLRDVNVSITDVERDDWAWKPGSQERGL